MAVKDTQYKYFPGQDRLVNVSTYMKRLNETYSSPEEPWDKSISEPNSGRHSRCSLNLPRAEASADFEMRNAVWSEEKTVKELLSLRLPVIVKVASGYYGNEEQYITADQILQIYRSYKELRVTADDGCGRALTLPTTFPLNVRLLSGSESSEEAQSLSQFLERNPLPAAVDVLEVTGKENSTDVSSDLFRSRLTFREISEHSFLLANAITAGWLDQSRFVVIPEQLSLKFRLALGTRQTTTEEWKDICGMYDRAARHFNFQLMTGPEGVIYDDWVNRTRPLIKDTSPRIESNRSVLPSSGKNDDEVDGDSDDDPRKNRSRLPWQQIPLSQRSLPSIPTALNDPTSFPTDRSESTPLGSSTPSRVSTESLHPYKSTESLLPRRSVDSAPINKCPVNAGKQKLKVPSRLRRRKDNSKKEGIGHGSSARLDANSDTPYVSTKSIVSRYVEATSLKVPISRSSAQGLNKDFGSRSSEQMLSISSASSASPFTDRKMKSLGALDDSKVSQFTLQSWENPSAKTSGFESNSSTESEPPGVYAGILKERSTQIHPPLSKGVVSQQQGKRTFNKNQDKVPSSEVVENWQHDGCERLRVNSAVIQDTRHPIVEGRNRQGAPIQRSLGVETTTPLSSKQKLDSAPLQIPLELHQLESLDSARSLGDSFSTDLSVTDINIRYDDGTFFSDPVSFPDVKAKHEAGTCNDAANRRRPTLDQDHRVGHPQKSSIVASRANHPVTHADLRKPLRLAGSRCRTQTNGSVKMRLDQSGSSLIIGSADNNNNIKGNCMTSSLKTLRDAS